MKCAETPTVLNCYDCPNKCKSFKEYLAKQ
jgi:hypothetical protein